MRLYNMTELNEFMAIVNACEGAVWLESNAGDKFNLKSNLSQYIALGALLEHDGAELELFCSSREDEAKFVAFFGKHPRTA